MNPVFETSGMLNVPPTMDSIQHIILITAETFETASLLKYSAFFPHGVETVYGFRDVLRIHIPKYNWLVDIFVKETQWLFLELGRECLNVIWMDFTNEKGRLK
jgi:hypothetical protein